MVPGWPQRAATQAEQYGKTWFGMWWLRDKIWWGLRMAMSAAPIVAPMAVVAATATSCNTQIWGWELICTHDIQQNSWEVSTWVNAIDITWWEWVFPVKIKLPELPTSRCDKLDVKVTRNAFQLVWWLSYDANSKDPITWEAVVQLEYEQADVWDVITVYIPFKVPRNPNWWWWCIISLEIEVLWDTQPSLAPNNTSYRAFATGTVQAVTT